jgi:hypothetical protein
MVATAQPVLQYADLTSIGTSFAIHLVTNAGTSNPMPDGANITWDFSSATLQMNVGTLSWVNPATTPQGSSFPTSNLAQKVSLPTGTLYNYFNSQPSQLDQLANEIGAGGENMTYAEPKTPLIFPMVYQQSFVDTYNDGSPESVTRSYTGYGTVILPTGTYTNVVKISNSSGAIDFLTTDPIAQLVHIEDDGSAMVLGDPVNAIQEQSAPALHLWPNPAKDAVLVSGVRSAGTWSLVDAQGRVERSGSMVAGPLELSLDGLAPGCYGLVLRSATASQCLRLVKQ